MVNNSSHPGSQTPSIDSQVAVPIHTAVRGRARFKVAGLYRSPTAKVYIENVLGGAKGIKTIEASPLTGNVLVNFDTSYDTYDIASMITNAVNGAVRNNYKTLPSVNDFRANTTSTDRKGTSSANALVHEVSSNSGDHPAWHVIDAGEVIKKTGSSLNTGLTSSLAAVRLNAYGPNALPEFASRSRLGILLDQLSSTPILLLIAAAGTSILTGGLADAAVILGVVGLNAAIGYVTETQSERTIESLKTLVRPSATVIRDGRPQEVPVPQVTVGDLLMLAPGSYVAADSRLVEVDGLSVDESALTGESIPVTKTAEKNSSADVALADRFNMVYMGTLVTGGQGLAVVVATGRHTEVGRIHALTADAEAPQTPMQRQLDTMGRQLVMLVSGVCVVIFGIGILHGYPLAGMFQTAIALAVAAVPEGLPTIATTILALGILRMRNLNVLIRRLDAVETLGSVQAICFDKTGTLTLNRMSVAAARANGRAFEMSNTGFLESDRRIDPKCEPELQHLLDACVLCSETVIEKRDGAYSLKGSPTENALIHAAIAADRDVMELRRQYPTIKVRLRSEDRVFMSTVHRNLNRGSGAHFVTFVKGSPEQVLAMCSLQLKQGRRKKLTDEDRRAIEAENERMAADSLRVLGCAWREDEKEPANNNGPQTEFVWLGLIGLADPIRDGMREVVQGFHRAGIDTVMITGDQSPTALAIGTKLHLSRYGPLEILDSTQMANVDVEVLRGLAEKVHVFARVSPSHKLQIVRALQQANKIVAMTGDGINDSPALKAADIGIAMGTGGTDVAREVADVILGDDELQTMLVAISQGRTIYSNIRKAVRFLLSTNLSEVAVMFLAMVAGLGQPLTAMQLLWINLISETSLGLALALDPPEPGAMEQPPRDPDEPIITSHDLNRMGFEALTLSAGSLAAYGYGISRYGAGPRAGTLGFTSLISGQILHALSSRSERSTIFDPSGREPNPVLAFTVAGSLALQGSVFLLPWLRNLLGITTISLGDAFIASAGAILPLLVNESAKKLLLEAPKPQTALRVVQLRS